MSYHKKIRIQYAADSFLMLNQTAARDKMRLRRLPRRRHSGLLRSSSARPAPIFVEIGIDFLGKGNAGHA
jgi:hypothetical protein